MYFDPSGELAYPGQIHSYVVNYIAAKYGLYREQTIDYKNTILWGRADLISSSGRVWEVKPNKAKHIKKGKKLRYAITSLREGVRQCRQLKKRDLKIQIK